MAKGSGGTRRRLTPERKREIARLYDETGTPTPEIRKRFGIGESSLYRVLQTQGVSLRGRAKRPVDGVAAGGVPTVAGARPRGRPSRGASPGPRGRGTRRTEATQDAAARQFRVRFQAQRVFDARDVLDAVRQAESLGAT